MDDWSYFEPNTALIYEIQVFDDGNERHRSCVNQWHIVGRWRGKVALRNVIDTSYAIKSVSEWKVRNLR